MWSNDFHEVLLSTQAHATNTRTIYAYRPLLERIYARPLTPRGNGHASTSGEPKDEATAIIEWHCVSTHNTLS